MSDEVYIAGHSLGGADALLYAYSRVKRGLRVDGVYAFASPRPGNRAIADGLVASGVLSVQNADDDVTWVPFDAHAGEMGWDYVDGAPFKVIRQPASWSDFLLDPFFCHHHIALYQAGVHAQIAANGYPVGVNEAVDEVARLYDTADGWNWINPVDGLYWAMQRLPNGARLMIRRGSKTGRDWLTEDFDFSQTEVYGAKVSKGFWSGVGPVQDKLDQALL